MVILQVRDGRRALLAFTGLDALQSWQPDARPVPVTIDIAAQAARSEELTVVLIDVAGPHPFVIEGEVLAELACWSSARRAARRPVRLDHSRSGLSACRRRRVIREYPILGHSVFAAVEIVNLWPMWRRGDILTATDSVVH